jgi:hypothetical protein
MLNPNQRPQVPIGLTGCNGFDIRVGGEIGWNFWYTGHGSEDTQPHNL